MCIFLCLSITVKWWQKQFYLRRKIINVTISEKKIRKKRSEIDKEKRIK